MRKDKSNTDFITKLIISIAVFFLYSWIFMLLYNSIISVLLNMSIITYWQSAGIYMMSNILFSRTYMGEFNDKN